jgi:non-ribosomal peptide synthetase component E (peptide arylation enzyme)
MGYAKGVITKKISGEDTMAKLTRSYVHGASTVPLIGETIGVRFDKVASRWSERDALIVRHQHLRWTYGELQRRVDAFAAGLLALEIASAYGHPTTPNGW